MHANSNTDFQDPIPVATSIFQELQVHCKHVSSNRIKIQVILLILQLETDYFSSYSFQKCSIRSSGTTVFTETSRTAILHEEVLQDSSAPILQGYPYTIQAYIQPPCTCPENSPSRIQFYMQKTKSSLSTSTTTTYRGQRDLHSRKENSMHRRQGDLLEIHPCVLQDLPRTFQKRNSTHRRQEDLLRNPSVCYKKFQDIPDIPVFPVFPDLPVVPDIPVIPDISVIHDIPASPGNSASSSTSRVSTPFQHSPIRMHILHILEILQFDWFPQKTPPSTSWTIQITNILQAFILQRKGDVVISVKIRIGKDVKMIYSPE